MEVSLSSLPNLIWVFLVPIFLYIGVRVVMFFMVWRKKLHLSRSLGMIIVYTNLVLSSMKILEISPSLMSVISPGIKTKKRNRSGLKI